MHYSNLVIIERPEGDYTPGDIQSAVGEAMGLRGFVQLPQQHLEPGADRA